MIRQGDLALLQDPVAVELLQSNIPARLAYAATDGSPRVIPIWFHWSGDRIVMGTPSTAPKVKALSRNPAVALTIDRNEFPAKVLLIRGTAELQTVDGLASEYAQAAVRYLGQEAGETWIQRARALFPQMVRIQVRPQWVGLLDFVHRFPSAIAKAIDPGSATRS